ncbi:MAG: galactokinase [Planctomycetia bacterium]|nr:galactokinase [Planctomycetia bacterium]
MKPPAPPIPARFTVHAPGRVNLIGEHTDYNAGFVLPMAIERGVSIAITRRADDACTFRSASEPGVATFDLGAPLTPGRTDWTRYPAGVIAGYRRLGWSIPGFDAAVTADLPAGGGLSSSAALEVATATAVETLCGRSLKPLERALLCQRAEHEFAGVPCGIMDQCAVACGRAGHALLIDCRSHEIRAVPFGDGDVSLLVVNSGVRHSLDDGEYARRRAECESAAARLGCRSLRDVTPEGWAACRDALPDRERRRARHVLTENERTLAFVTALGRRDWPAAGRLMRDSHASLRDDYEVSCRELDLLYELASDMPGVFGCRMTGGGFGGCAIALVSSAAADATAEAIRRGYRDATGIDAVMFTTAAAAGPRIETR